MLAVVDGEPVPTRSEARLIARAVAQANGWLNDECRQAAFWFCNTDGIYQEQLSTQPKPFLNTQEDVDRYEVQLDNYVITLEELANVGGFSPDNGVRDDVDWEVVADYLIAVREAQGG